MTHLTKWIEYLSGDVRERLKNCCSTKEDILPLAQAKWRILKLAGRGWQREDALISILELLDCNSQYFDLTRDEYDEILMQIV